MVQSGYIEGVRERYCLLQRVSEVTLLRRFRVAFFLAALVCLVPGPGLTAQQGPPTQSGHPAASEQTTPVFRTTVRRVVLDVVVTDSAGKPVRGLTQEDFTVEEDGKPQQVLSFDANGFNPGMDYLPPKLPPEPPNTFVNLPPTPEKGPLYVLLYDLVNMDNEDQMFGTVNQHDDQMVARQQLLKFIQEKPEGARFAIFVWSDGLHMIQGFTSDKAKLLTAVDPHHPGPHIPMVYLMGQNTGRGDTHATIWVLNILANYLDGLPGRKNLIWFSGAFPLSFFSSDDEGPLYKQQLQSTLDLMAKDEIAIYPVDARGVVLANWRGGTTAPGYDAPVVSQRMTGAPAAAPAQSSQSGASATAHAGGGVSLLASSYMTEDEIAKVTGGRAIYSTNDLKTALLDATEAGQSYYTLTYAPTNQDYNGNARNIRVELAKKGYTLAYRRFYFGSDPDAPLPEPKRRAAAAPAPPAPRKVGDTLYANMEHGAPIAHQLIFGAHVQAVGAPAKGTPEQMAELADQPAFFKTRRKNAPAKPLPPIELQKYAIDYTVMAHQLQIDGEPPNLEIAAAAYDADGKMLNAIVNNATTDDAGSPANATQRKSYRAQQELDVPVTARTIRVAVRDANTDRIGAMEITLPLQPESQATTSAQSAPAHP